MDEAAAARPLVRAASGLTVAAAFRMQARLRGDAPALQEGTQTRSYRELDARVRGWRACSPCGVARGDRVAMLSENRGEYLELFLAAARLGAIVACQNWRLAPAELAHCLRLVEPTPGRRLAAPRADAAALRRTRRRHAAARRGVRAALAAAIPPRTRDDVDPEDALVILYTSGTTGLPKGAVISHRAEIARNLVARAEFGMRGRTTPSSRGRRSTTWAPPTSRSATLMSGGKVIVVDGFEPAAPRRDRRPRALGWLLLMPGMVGRLRRELRRAPARPRGVKRVRRDGRPRAAAPSIAEITGLLGAPYANTFGATETGCPPCSSA